LDHGSVCDLTVSFEKGVQHDEDWLGENGRETNDEKGDPNVGCMVDIEIETSAKLLTSWRCSESPSFLKRPGETGEWNN
jgi:hypothetical protein